MNTLCLICVLGGKEIHLYRLKIFKTNFNNLLLKNKYIIIIAIVKWDERRLKMTSKKQISQYLLGMCAAVPIILGFVPVGIAYAIMARQAGFTVSQTCGMSLAVFAGASQMMAVGMYGGYR